MQMRHCNPSLPVEDPQKQIARALEVAEIIFLVSIIPAENALTKGFVWNDSSKKTSPPKWYSKSIS